MRVFGTNYWYTKGMAFSALVMETVISEKYLPLVLFGLFRRPITAI